MVTKDLLDFIRSELEAGITHEEIEASLIGEGGWDKADVEEALAELERDMVASLPPAPVPAPAASVVAVAPVQVSEEAAVAFDPLIPVETPMPASPPPVTSAPVLAPPVAPVQHAQAAPSAHIDKIIPDPSLAVDAEKIPERWARYQGETSSSKEIADTAARQAAPEKAIAARPIADIWAEYGSESHEASAAAIAEGALGDREPILGDGSFPVARESTRPMLTSSASVVTAGSGRTGETVLPPLAPGMPVRRVASSGPSGYSPRAEVSSGGTGMKTILLALAGAIILLGIAAGGWFYLEQRAEPGVIAVPVENAVSGLFSADSFTYAMTLSGDLAMVKEIDRSGPASMEVRTGSAMSGAVAMAPDGFGNGAHLLRFSGSFAEDGEILFGADTEAEYRVVGENIYVRFVNPPRADIVDPEVFTSYWIRVSMTEIAKQLELEGVGVTDEDLGRFGGSEATSFVGALKKTAPFTVVDTLSDEPVDGVPPYHFKLAFKEAETIAFLQSLYRQYFNTELVFSDEDQVRLGQLLKKLTAEAWVARADGTLRKFSLSGPVDDVMFGYRARGSVSLAVTLAPAPEAAAVAIPAPTLSVEEFKNRIDAYLAKQEIRTRDALRLELLDDLERGLAAYKRDKGRYPPVLEDLALGGYLSTSTPKNVLGQYSYHPYASLETLDKAHRCANRAKLCPFYHLGVNLEDPENLRLDSDADITAELRGKDTAGCSGEPGRSCLDLVPRAAAAP